MSINSTASSVSSASTSAQVSSSSGTDSSKKTSSDASFKDEMDKVSSNEKSNESKVNDSDINNENKVKDTDNADKTDKKTENYDSESKIIPDEDLKFASLSMNDVNSMLSNDIQQMMNSSNTINNGIVFDNLFSFSKDSGLFNLDFTNSLNVSESDAMFFVELTKNDNITSQNVIAQAQMAIEGGAELEQVQQNVKISQTLLNAINTARENNQPLRIDFDQNIAVILRMGKDGSFSANFIPGDKVVEQYLKNNIESLKYTFDEKDLPYTDLSYSNRGSKQQKEQRRNKE